MGVYRKKDGRWFVVYSQAGRRVWEAFGRGDEAEVSARARDHEIQAARLRGKLSGSLGPGLTYGDVCQLYLNARGRYLSGETRRLIMIAQMKYAVPVIGEKRIGDINMADWHKIEAGMTECKPQTINLYFSRIAAPLRWAVEENDLIEDHPWRKRRNLKPRDKYVPDLLTVPEFQRIRAAAAPHVAWAMEVAYHTGVRVGPSELLALQWEHVDWEGGRLHVFSAKTKNWRWVPLSGSFMARLSAKHAEARRRHPDCELICHRAGAPVRDMRYQWGLALGRAGITRRIRPYDIRHFYASYALAGGMDIMELAYILGHVNANMIVNVYAHRAKELRKRKQAQLPDIYGKPKRARTA